MESKATGAIQRLRVLRGSFQAAHAAGMAALEAGDMEGFGKAIATERAILDEQELVYSELLKAQA